MAFGFDVVFAVALVATCFLNKQALPVIFAHILFMLCMLLPLDDFWSTLVSATIYAAFGAAFIKLKSEIRYALFCQSCLYYLNSVDYVLAAGAETLYYVSVPYFITVVDFYIVWQLVKGEPQHVRCYRIGRCGLLHL